MCGSCVPSPRQSRMLPTLATFDAKHGQARVWWGRDREGGDAPEVLVPLSGSANDFAQAKSGSAVSPARGESGDRVRRAFA